MLARRLRSLAVRLLQCQTLTAGYMIKTVSTLLLLKKSRKLNVDVSKNMQKLNPVLNTMKVRAYGQLNVI